MSPFDASIPPSPSLIDSFGRAVTYLRLSVTDRCDLRCVYCMPERMAFLPRNEALTLEELERIARAFIALGVRKLRVTGGEPLVRKGVMGLIAALGGELRAGGLSELTLTTNGSRLAEHAEGLAEAGVRRVNVSLDTLDAARFTRLTRGGDLARTLAGIEAAVGAGLSVKLNAVALKGENEAEIPDLIAWAHGRGHDVTLIETMPLGEVGEARMDRFLSLAEVRGDLEARWTLTDLPLATGGPARYVKVAETGGRVGFITPLSHNFCAGCNRVRLTCAGVLHTCLGREDAVDLRAILRAGGSDADLAAAIRASIAAKPQGHDFRLTDRAALARHMSTTGG